MKKGTVIKLIISFLIAILIPILIISISPFSFWGGQWKTQDILFVNKNKQNVQIEFQMQDIGAFGYNKRIVKVKKGFLWDSQSSFDTVNIDTTEWKFVNNFVNELEIKMP